jgi:hypothetical protein
VAPTSTVIPAEWTLSSAGDSGLLNAPLPGVRCGQLLRGPELGGRAQVAYGDGLVRGLIAFTPPGPDDPPGPAAWRGGSSLGVLSETRLVGGGDLDGDGIFDFAVREDRLPTSVHYGSGAGAGHVYDAYSHRFYVGPLAPPIALASVDLDRDGHEDLAVTSASNETFLLGRAGGLSFLQEASLPGLTPVGAGDYDGNGFPDLFGILDRELVVAPFVCNTDPGLSAPCPVGQITLPIGTGVVVASRACNSALRNLTPATVSALASGTSTPLGSFRKGELLATEHNNEQTGCQDSPSGVAAFARDPDDPTSWLRHQALDLSTFDSLTLVSFDDLTGDGIPDALFFFDDGIETILGLSRGSGHGASFTLDPPDLSNAGRLATLDGGNWAVLPDAPRHRVLWLSALDEHALDVNVVKLDGTAAATHLDLGPLRLAGLRSSEPAIAGGSLAVADLDGDGNGWLVFLAGDDHDLYVGASAILATGKLDAPVYTHVGAGGGAARAFHLIDLDGPDPVDGTHHPSLVLASARAPGATPEWLQVWTNGRGGRFKPQPGR